MRTAEAHDVQSYERLLRWVAKAWAQTPDDAEDAFCDVRLFLLKRWNTYRPEYGSRRNWLCRNARWFFNDRRKYAERHEIAALPYFASIALFREDEIVEAIAIEDVLRRIRPFHVARVLQRLRGESISEIARREGVSHAAVWQTFALVRRGVRGGE